MWNLAIRIPYRQANIQRIERGLHEPRVSLAIRMLSALGVDAGCVLDTLARREGLLNVDVKRIPWIDWEKLKWNVFRTEQQGTVRSPFGLFLRASRLASGKTQKAVAESAGYALRNLANVEKGIQDPGIFLALRLALAAYGDPKIFFHHFQDIANELSFEGKRID